MEDCDLINANLSNDKKGVEESYLLYFTIGKIALHCGTVIVKVAVM